MEDNKIENSKIEDNTKEEVKEEVKIEIKEDTETKKNTKAKKAKKEKKSWAREALEWVVCIVTAFVLAVFIKYFIFTPTLVQMSSMYPTIFSNERVFLNRLVRTFNMDLNHGDIITFEAPINSEETVKHLLEGNIKAEYYDRKGFSWFTYNVLEINKISYIKRVIGLPGDHIELKDGKVYLNGKELDESSYLPDGTETYGRYDNILCDFIVPEGYVFAMGDNRSGSQDCRAFGCIPKEKVEGRVVFRIWPLTKFGAINKSEITKTEVDEYNASRF